MPTADLKPLLLPNTKVSMLKQGSALKEDYQLKFQILSQKVEEKKFIIEQGYEMMRPGNIFVEIDEPTAIRVGGNARLVFKGDLYLK